MKQLRFKGLREQSVFENYDYIVTNENEKLKRILGRIDDEKFMSIVNSKELLSKEIIKKIILDECEEE